MTPSSNQERRRLAERHTYLIRKVISHMKMRLPTHVQREDLIGVAALGLLDAAEKYDPERGKDFSVYAEYRIRGAIMDELRNRDPMPRVLRGKVKKLERTIDELTHGLGRLPEDDEVAGALGIQLSKYHEMRLQVEHASTVAYHEEASPRYAPFLISPHSAELVETSSSGRPSYVGSESKDENVEYGPLQEVMLKEQVEVLSEAISELDTRDQLILSLHYQENLNFRQIGEVLGLTESRISQLHKGALLALRDKLERFDQAE